MFCGADEALHDINDLIVELDRQASLAPVPTGATRRRWVERRHARYPYRVKCILRVFSAGYEQPLEIPGRTRNLSRGGVGLLVRCVISVNEPAEVELTRGAGDTLYMAGMVRFCRYAGMGFHEIGIALKAAGGAPVFPKTASGAQSVLAWLQQA